MSAVHHIPTIPFIPVNYHPTLPYANSYGQTVL